MCRRHWPERYATGSIDIKGGIGSSLQPPFFWPISDGGHEGRAASFHAPICSAFEVERGVGCPTDNVMEMDGDILLKGGTVLNVYSGELIKADVAVRKGRVWSVGSPPNLVHADRDPLVLDMEKRVLVPGYVDAHFHPWNIYNPLSFGEEASRLGITTLVCDNLIFYMLMGLDRFEAFMDRFSDMPIKFFWFCRAVPQTPMEREDELFSVENLKRLLENPNVMSLGEITRWQEVVRGDAKILEMAGLAKSLRKRVDGHTAGAKYEHLNAIARAGVESCHESISGEEMLERLRLGLYVMLRESSLRQDLGGLLKTVKESGVLTDRMMLTTDSSTPAYYDEWGIFDHLIRIAIREGIDPVSAYRMSTINPAVYLGLEHEIGGIAPGRSADIVVLKNLEDPSPEMVMSKGRIIAEEGHLIEPFPRVDWEKFFPAASFSNRTWFAKPDFFQIPSRGKGLSFPVMKLVSPVITREIRAEFRVVQGVLDLKGRPGFCLTALLSRDGKWVSNGILEGFGEGIEGLASTFNTATQILVIGREPEAMSAAVNRVLEIGGGIVAVEQGGIAYELPLPLGGMMSDAPMEQVAKKDREFREFLSKRGYPFHDPLYTLIFLPNDFLPEVRINYRGLVNIRKNRVLRPRRDLAQP